MGRLMPSAGIGLRFPLILVCLVFAISIHAADSEQQSKARQVWQLFDYLAVDYSGAVRNSAVISISEYAEMQEFASTAQRLLVELPDTAGKEAMQERAVQLRNEVAGKAAPDVVAQLAHQLAADVLKACPLPVVLVVVPDLQRGAMLFDSQCAGRPICIRRCHRY